MSNLEELKNKLCPNGVEFKKLENLFNIRNGYTPSKKNESYWTGNTIIPWFRLEDIRENGRVLKDSIQHVTPEAIKGELFEKDSLIISTSATIGEQALIETDFLVNQRFTVLTLKEEFKEKFLPKFLLHYAYILSQYCKDNTNLGTFQSVDMTKFRNFEIPIPPLEVQAEIVRILDTFTELIKELIKEQELRKKQYSYYRDKLLTFEIDIQYKNLSDICSFIYGYTEKAKDEGNARFVRITDILETGCLNPEGAKYINLTSECEKYLLKKGDLLTARAGATYGKTLYFDEDYPAVYASYLIKLNLDNNLILNRYYWHFAKSSYYWKQANKLAVGGAQPNLNANSLAKIIVPLPTLDTQKRIVDILDNFEKYCNDLQIGLPAEIEARKKQYNFYRDKLLTFEPINIAKIEKEIDEILTNEPNCDSLRREEKRREEKRREEKRREEKNN